MGKCAPHRGNSLCERESGDFDDLTEKFSMAGQKDEMKVVWRGKERSNHIGPVAT